MLQVTNKYGYIFRMILIIVSIALIYGITIPVFAGASESSTATVYGIQYGYYSAIDNYSNTVQGYACAYPVNSTAPAGYIGLKARLYSSSGDIVSSSDWTYNIVNLSSGHAALVSCHISTSNGTYYAKGQAQFYNGNGYTTYDCTQTEILSPLSINPVVYRNQNNEIYGSELFLNTIGIEPDLLSVIGIHGVRGFVKNTDLNLPPIESPESAIRYTLHQSADRIILVYTEDGVTIVDKFIVRN